MALLLKNGSVFLHIPKTGGRWIAAILDDLDLIERNVSPRHADIDHYFSHSQSNSRKSILGHAARDILSFPQSKPFMFCFVRSPLSWYESWFKYMSRSGSPWQNWGDEHDAHNWHPNAMLNGLGSDDFNEFVRNVIHKRPGYVTELFGWYTRSEMNFIGKQENLVDDFIRVLRVMNVDFDEEYIRNHKRVGVSPVPRKQIRWDEGLRDELSQIEYAGLVRYGYQSGAIGGSQSQ